MATFTGSSSYGPGNTQNMNASFQADALGGGDLGGGDLSGLLEQLMARKAKQDRAAKTVRAPKAQPNREPMKLNLAQRRIQAQASLPEQTAAQRGVTAVGGMTGGAYRDMSRQMMTNTLMGVPQTEYTGWTDLVKALQAGGGGQAAEEMAGRMRLRNAGTQLQALERE